ncbi:MAG: DoxX-like family protein [Hydrogenophaga sp.]|uniref:DoxX-like family protein n=1 Tax=Hydrogenophaga sp. TaxID=1904254 RepID=UPI003D123397
MNNHALLRWSLVEVWLATGLVSLWEWQGQSLALLAPLETPHDWVKPVLIGTGAGVDIVLAIWLACRPSRPAFAAALAAMVGMTALATWIQPGWWLHPLGPLTKNLPIAAILLVLLRSPKETR